MSFIQQIKEYMDNSIVDEILLLALFIAIVETIAQNNIKNSEHKSLKFMLGLGFYMILGYILHYAYHKYPLSKINVIWSCVSIIFAMILGYSLYDEPFNHWSGIAIILALGAIMCSFKAGEI
jgi:multidrug transporter EmrE-like cation transporter